MNTAKYHIIKQLEARKQQYLADNDFEGVPNIKFILKHLK